MAEGTQTKIIKVLMLPWLGHGHISPYLELAKRLSIRNFHIYFCSTPINLKSIKEKLTQKTNSSSIELVELHLPSSPELPPHYHTSNGLPPHLMIHLKKAFELSAAQFSVLLQSLTPDLVIYDFNQPWAAEIASSQAIPAVEFVIIGAAMVAFGLHLMKNPGEEFPFPEIYLRGYEKRKMLQNQGDKDKILQATNHSYKIFLLKSCREIEGKFIDYLSETYDKKFVPLGPLVPEDLTSSNDDDRDKEIMEWLDQKEKSSVVYASFGSEYYLTQQEIVAMSQGLDLSNVNFIWALRFPVGEEENISIKEVLPDGFLDKIGNRGKIVKGWAPQAKILKHSSTGGFLSHCGWCSVMESLMWGGCGGIPIIGVPMHSDQPVNARVVEAIGVGVEAVRDEEGNLLGEEIAKVIRMVMVDDSGAEIRRKAKELGETLVAKGDAEIDNLSIELAQLCSTEYSK
ncbi:OLC1v1031097C2 [Oldenlandia corymbosa var. corymbosa]|nr:OLC1v1031097C2 [Oldenlandia corymbosa var. corymbosa]